MITHMIQLDVEEHSFMTHFKVYVVDDGDEYENDSEEFASVCDNFNDELYIYDWSG